MKNLMKRQAILNGDSIYTRVYEITDRLNNRKLLFARFHLNKEGAVIVSFDMALKRSETSGMPCSLSNAGLKSYNSPLNGVGTVYPERMLDSLVDNPEVSIFEMLDDLYEDEDGFTAFDGEVKKWIESGTSNLVEVR